MAKIATSTALEPIASPASNPITLRARVNVAVKLPPGNSPTGAVQFFDGDLFLGQAAVQVGSDGVVRATLAGVARPVGTRALKAVYQGDTLFAGSTSPILQVTIQ
jgi:hypothetical protein